MKKQKPIFSNDEIRKKVLEFLNICRQKARSIGGMSATITDIKRGLKPFGFSQNEVVTNLDFLVQNGWVKEDIIERKYKTPRGFEVPSEKRLYKLSDLGIRYFEETSIFEISKSYSGINITNIQGVTVVGSNNVIRAEFIDIFRKLNQLENSMKLSEKLTDEQKLAVLSDTQTIKDQLSKLTPDKSIINLAISAISFLGSIPGVMELFNIVKKALESLIK